MGEQGGSPSGPGFIGQHIDNMSAPAPAPPPPGAAPLPLGGNQQAPSGGAQSGMPGPFDDAASNITRIGADLAATAGGAGYKFDADGIQQVIDSIETELQSLNKERRKLQALTQVAPPGDELASQNVANDANTSGGSYGSYFREVFQYLEKYLDHLKQTRDAYQEREQQTADDLNGKEA